MPFQASSLAMVQSTETWRTSPAWTQGRGRFRACAARIFCVRVIGRRVCAETIGAATCIVLAPSATGVVNKYAGEGMETWYERLSTLDSLFLELEDRSAHMHVGAVAIFEGPPPPYRDLLALIEARLEDVPRYRQRIMTVPLKQGRPVWIDETQFDLEYHVRHTALPAPGGEPELKRLVGRLFSQALDRDKPLWEMWLVEGLGDGRFAIISKTHHAMIDGVSGVDLATILMDSEPASSPPPAPSSWTPRKSPPVSQLLVKSVKEQITHPLRMVREALEPNSEAVKLFGQLF